MAIADAPKSDANPLDEPSINETSELSQVQEIRDEATIETTQSGKKPDTRVKGRCNTLKRDCKNPPLPGEYYCAWDLHTPHMKPHAERKLDDAQRKLDFLGIGLGDSFAPATSLLKKARTAFDVEEFSAAYHLAVQAMGKAVELNARPRVEKAIVLRDEFGFLDQRASNLATQAESEAKKPRPNWSQASVWAAEAINALQLYHDRAERSRQVRLEQAQAKVDEQARAKAAREAHEAAKKAEREQRAASLGESIGTVPNNNGTLSEADRRQVEQMRRTPAPGANKHEKKEPKSKNGKKKSSKGKKDS